MKINRNLKNIFSLFSVEFLSRLIGFAAITYLARVLGKSSFGIINIGLAVLSYAMIIGNSGLSMMGTRKIASKIQHDEAMTSEILFARFITSIAVYLFTALIIYLFLSSIEVINVILIYNLFLFPSAFLLEWFFHGHQKMDTISKGRIIGMAAYLIIILLLVKKPDDILLTGVAWTAGGVINALYLIYVFKKLNFKIKLDLKIFAIFSLIKKSFSLGTPIIMAQFVAMFPIIYLGIVAASSDVGSYSAAYKVVILFLVFDRVFNALFFPKVIHYFNESPGMLEEVLKHILKIISLFSLSISIIAIICGEILIVNIFGNIFSDAINVFRVLMGYFAFTLINSVFTYTLIAMNKENIYTWAMFWGMIIFILSTIVLTNYLSIIGPAIGLVLFEFTSLILMASKLEKELRLNFSRNILLPVAVSFIFLLVLLSVRIVLPFQIILALLVVIPCIGYLSGISIDEIKFIKKVFI